MTYTYSDDENGFHAYDSGDGDGDDWVSEYIELYEYNRRFEESAAEAASVPAGGVTDSAAADVSWRAEVVAAALKQDWARAQVKFYRDSAKSYRRMSRRAGRLYVSDGRCFSISEGMVL